jgi:hypothetical protein
MEKFSIPENRKEFVKLCTAELETDKPRSAWSRGVQNYTAELFDNVLNFWNDYAGEKLNYKDFEKLMLNGADNWDQYSNGGTLCYNQDIAERLFTPSQLKRWRNTNWNIDLLELQAQALRQAARHAFTIAKCIWNRQNQEF